MPYSLHTDKIKDEKNAFVAEVYNVIPSKEKLISGEWSSQSNRIHKLYLALYIMNYHKSDNLRSTYFNHLLTAAIESEALFFSGYKNAALMQLRCATEAAFKFLYYETHPIEWELHTTTDFDLRGIEYREFFYQHPKFAKLNMQKESVENNWKELCQYSHYDIHIVQDISCVLEITNTMNNEMELQDSLKKIKNSIKEMICIFFMVDPRWLEGVEKAYFDYVFEVLFTADERINIIDTLGVY